MSIYERRKEGRVDKKLEKNVNDCYKLKLSGCCKIKPFLVSWKVKKREN